MRTFRRVSRSSAILAAAVCLLSCHAILGVEDRALDPIANGCELPNEGTARVRFANLVPSDERVDVCLRSTGSSYRRPALRGGGSADVCGSGVAYAEVTAPFRAPAGSVDVKVVRAGDGCDEHALAEATVTLAEGRTTTLARLGSAGGEERVAAYGESAAEGTGEGARLRVIHASARSPAYTFGFTRTPALPSEVDQPILATPLSYGDSTTPSTKSAVGSIDEFGYVRLASVPLPVGIAPSTEKRATALIKLPTTALPQTLFIVGDANEPYMPVRLLLCDERVADGRRTRCTLSPLSTLSIDLFHAYLLGPHAVDEDLRREPILQALTRRDSHLVCATAISRRADRERLVQLGRDKGTFPHAIHVVTTLDTKVTDPRDENGMTPAPPSRAPCGAPVDPAAVESAIGCLQAKCSTSGKGDGTLAGGSACIASHCVADLVPLYAGTREQKLCFNCIVGSALSEATHDRSRAQCTTDKREYKLRDGDNAIAVLSRYPLRDVDTYVLPSTFAQRVVHYAKVEIEAGKLIDFFCTELNPHYGDALPYVGHYAKEGSENPWADEQVFQARRALEWIKRKAENRPAIVAGDWGASRRYVDADGKEIVTAQGGFAMFDLLDRELVPALPVGFVPRCTECAAPVNPYAVANLWHYRAYVYNLPKHSGAAASIFFDDMPLKTSTGEPRPLSARWGFNVQVLRP